MFSEREISAREVERKFERWGRVVDVYIARRRNNMGIFFLVLLDIQELKTRNGLRNNKEMYGVDNIRSGLAYQDL